MPRKGHSEEQIVIRKADFGQVAASRTFRNAKSFSS